MPVTYIEKYGCEQEYFKLKECYVNTPQHEQRRQCDKYYELIG